MTPKHFSSAANFQSYILTCAIRDRETFLEAITPSFAEPNKETMVNIKETQAEIMAMKQRLMRSHNKAKGMR